MCTELSLTRLLQQRYTYALLMRANKPETAVQSSTSFFSCHHMVYFVHMFFYTLCLTQTPDSYRQTLTDNTGSATVESLRAGHMNAFQDLCLRSSTVHRGHESGTQTFVEELIRPTHVYRSCEL